MKKLVESEEYAAGTLTHFETTYGHVESFLMWKYSTKDIDLKRSTTSLLLTSSFILKQKDRVHITRQ